MIHLMEPSMSSDPKTELANRQDPLAPLLSLVPTFINQAGEHAPRRFVEFFTANVQNPNTRLAYARAVRVFIAWCEDRGLGLHQLEPTLALGLAEREGELAHDFL